MVVHYTPRSARELKGHGPFTDAPPSLAAPRAEPWLLQLGPWTFPSPVVTPQKPSAQPWQLCPNSCFLVLVGIVRLRDGLRDRYPVEDYLDLFDLAAHQIHQGLQASSAKEQSKMNRIIIGMASV